MRGAFLLLKTEPSVQVQAIIAICMIFAGCYFNISKEEWIMQTLAIGLVLSLEGANTAIEEIEDFAAGAVFFAALVAVIIGILIYYPYIVNINL